MPTFIDPTFNLERISRNAKFRNHTTVSKHVCATCSVSFSGSHNRKRCDTCQKSYRLLRRKTISLRYRIKNQDNVRRIGRESARYIRLIDPSKLRDRDITKAHKRKCQILCNEGSHTTKEWLALVKKYKGKCANCHKKTKLTRDHIMPVSRGGSNYISNIQPLCKSCNSSKRDRIW